MAEDVEDSDDSDDEYEDEDDELDENEAADIANAEEGSEVQEMSVINEEEMEDDSMHFSRLISCLLLVYTLVPPLLDQENEVITDLEDLPLAPETLELRETIFRVVDKLQAFMPDPESAMPWFKRCLKHIRTAQQTADMTWYPWGSPPMVCIHTTKLLVFNLLGKTHLCLKRRGSLRERSCSLHNFTLSTTAVPSRTRL
jgi:hypothetical protein